MEEVVATAVEPTETALNDVGPARKREPFDPYEIALGLQPYPEVRSPFQFHPHVANDKTIWALPEVPVWSPSKRVVKDPPPRHPFIPSPSKPRVEYFPPSTPFVASPSTPKPKVYSVTVSSCKPKVVEVMRDAVGSDTVGPEVNCGKDRENQPACAQHDGGHQDERVYKADSAGYDADDEDESANEAECADRDGEDTEDYAKEVNFGVPDGAHDPGQNVCDVTDDETNRTGNVNRTQPSNEFIEDEAEEVDDAQVEAEEEGIVTESSASQYSNGTEETLWQSHATNDDPRDGDYDADAASEPGTDDDGGVPIMVIDNNSVGGDDLAA